MIYKYAFYVNDTVDPTRSYSKFDGYLPGAFMKFGYAATVEAESDFDALERLFEIFNINHPADYRMQSMSCGDVVVLYKETGAVAYALNSEITGKLIGVEGGWQKLDAFDPAGDPSKGWMDYEGYKRSRT
jgi:hypothetical protein